MDVKLSDKQIKQFSLTLSVDDVLNCIMKDIDSYMEFLNDELKCNEITQEEYEKELLLINTLNKKVEVIKNGI